MEKLLFIDTETCGSVGSTKNLPFDISFRVVDEYTQEVLYSKGCIVKELFENTLLMQSAQFSSGKYKDYKRELRTKSSDYIILPVKDIFSELRKVIRKYDISYVVAHNIRFDKQAINSLAKLFRLKSPFEGIQTIDTMKLARETIAETLEYKAFCLDNINKKDINNESMFVTKNGKPRVTVQALYTYISGNPDFAEEHLGLYDISNEIEIYFTCLSI